MTEVEKIFTRGLSRIERTIDDSGYAFTALDVSGNGLESVEHIAKYRHLQYANLSKNQIKDLSTLDRLEYLLGLNLAENGIKDAPALNNPQLQVVKLDGNQLTTLSGMEGSSITSLDVSKNKIVSVEGLEKFESLKSINLSYNQLSSFDTLTLKAPNLEKLDVNVNVLVDVNGMELLPKVTSISLQNNKIKDFDVLQKLTSLKELTSLHLSGNPLCQADAYRLRVLILVPQLLLLDGVQVTEKERVHSIELRKERQKETDALAAAQAANEYQQK